MKEHDFMPAAASPFEYGYYDGAEQIAFLEKRAEGISLARLVLADAMPEYSESVASKVMFDLLLESQVDKTLGDLNIAEEHYRSTHDFATGLYNVRGMEEDVFPRIKGRAYGAVLVDPTNFKKINDKLSYDEGTAFIVSLAKILEKATRHGDYAARIGGDELLLMVNLEPQGNKRRGTDLSPKNKVQAVKDRIANASQLLLEEQPKLKKLGVEVAIGTAQWGSTSTVKSLKKAAERQMKEHKAQQHAILGKYRS